MSSFPGNPSGLGTSHGLSGRRVLLPYEADLCNTVGITAEQYFEFLDEAEATVIKREGYEHIPDIQAGIDPVTLAVVQLVVGLALTAAAVLMAPKPRSSSDERVDIKRPDQIGPNRFTPTFSFNSVQELARLGQTVPLVFADQIPATEGQQLAADKSVLRGGTRANSLLTFSMLSSTGGGQRLRVYGVAGFCGNKNNQIRRRPDYDGLAFGDQLVRDYNPARIAAYFKGDLIDENKNNDGTISRDDQYKIQGYKDEDLLIPPQADPSKVWWHPTESFEHTFVGARNPSNESEFGAYSPIPNGNYWKLDFQMFILPDNAQEEDKDRIRSIRQKIEAPFPVYGAVTEIKGKEVTYELNQEDKEWNDEEFFEDREGVTADDIQNQVNQQRFNIDAALIEGDMYLLNNQVGTLISKSQGPFEPGSRTITCKFRMTDDGAGAPPTVPNKSNSRRKDTNKPTHLTIPNWIAPGDSNQVQRFSDALIANNVACDCTEIGIGSTVWKRFQGANVNNFPGDDFISDLENNDAGGTYDLGRLDSYVYRYSFFHIQIRRQNDTVWSNVNIDGVFAVKGNTPVERFNAVRIYYKDRGQYEFRMRPYPSKLAWYRHSNNGKEIYLLESKEGLDERKASVVRLVGPDFEVFFEGRKLDIKEQGAVTNLETIKGDKGAKNFVYTVNGVSPTSWSPGSELGTGQWENKPATNNPTYKGPTYSNPSFDNDCVRDMVLRRVMHNSNQQRFVYFWNGDKVGDITVNGLEKPDDETLAQLQRSFPDAPCGTREDDDNVRYQPRSEQYRKAKNSSGIELFYYEIVRKERKTEKTPDGPAKVVNAVGGSGTGLKFSLQKYKDASYTWSIEEKGKNYKDGDKVRITQIPDEDLRIAIQGNKIGEVEGNDPGWWDVGDTAPYSMITDSYLRSNESSSHQNNPEHRITYINEFVRAPDTAIQGNYRYLASMGFVLNSSKQLTSLTQLSAYYQKGLRIEKLGTGIADGKRAASNIFPEIAYFLLTNRITGAGGVINKAQIDRESFERAADFCRANEYYWDGVIDERVNLRDFIHEQASYCLLDFTMKGGKFGLEPTVPYNSDYTIKTNDDAIPEIKALFTDGNIREMKVTTLPPEDRKLFEAEVLYREERINQFPQTRTLSVGLDRYPTDISVETFDFTQFCTSRRQALNFAKYALKARQWIDHVIEFQTTPQSMTNVEPGDYIRIVSHLCHPDRFATGNITADGVIQSSQEVTTGTQVYYWNPTFTKDAATNSFIRVGTLSIASDGKAQNSMRGCVFAVVSQTTTDRIYKVDTIAIGEEGFVTVSGTHMPVGGQGQLKVMTGWDDDRDFIINNSKA